MNEFWDRLGISASLLCIVHCLLTPLIVLLMPLVGHSLMHGWFHAVIIAVVVPVAAWALWNGYRLHRLKRVLWLGGFGIILICLAITVGARRYSYEVVLMTAAGLLLTAAHYVNLRVCRGLHHPHP
jgi:hypothetical protein